MHLNSEVVEVPCYFLQIVGGGGCACNCVHACAHVCSICECEGYTPMEWVEPEHRVIFPCHFASYFLNSLFLSLLATSKLQRSPCPHPTLLYIRVACTCSRLCFYLGAKDPLTAHTLLPTEPSPHFRFLHWYQHRSVWVTAAMMPPHLLQRWYKKNPYCFHSFNTEES